MQIELSIFHKTVTRKPKLINRLCHAQNFVEVRKLILHIVGKYKVICKLNLYHFLMHLRPSETKYATRREFLRDVLYKNIAIVNSKMYFVDTFGDFSHTVE